MAQKGPHDHEMVSVIVPLFNRKDLAAQTFDSVVNQTSDKWELIIVDDGSTDGVDVLAMEYAKRDERVRFFRRERLPKGAPTCRNIGLEKARGEFLVFLDSDDLLAPFCIEQRLEKFQVFEGCDFLIFPVASFEMEPSDAKRFWGMPSNKESDLDNFLSYSIPWSTSAPIWRTESFKKIGRWDETLFAGQDCELHIRALSKNLFYQRPTAVFDCFYRSGKRNSITEDIYTNEKKLRSWINLFNSVCSYELFPTPEVAQKRKKLIFESISSFALNHYLFSKRTFHPEKFLPVIRKNKLAPPFKHFAFSLFLYSLYLLERMGLRHFGLPVYSRVSKYFSTTKKRPVSGNLSKIINNEQWGEYDNLLKNNNIFQEKPAP